MIFLSHIYTAIKQYHIIFAIFHKKLGCQKLLVNVSNYVVIFIEKHMRSSQINMIACILVFFKMFTERM